jgi:hypothetical protein
MPNDGYRFRLRSLSYGGTGPASLAEPGVGKTSPASLVGRAVDAACFATCQAPQLANPPVQVL